MFQKGTKGHAIYTIIEAVLFIVAGILALAFRENTDAYAVAFIIVGVLIILSAAIGIIAHAILAAANPAVHQLFDAKSDSLLTTVFELALGIALLIAALAGHGESHVLNAESIDRGYEKVEERLGELGADIRRE